MVSFSKTKTQNLRDMLLMAKVTLKNFGNFFEKIFYGKKIKKPQKNFKKSQ